MPIVGNLDADAVLGQGHGCRLAPTAAAAAGNLEDSPHRKNAAIVKDQGCAINGKKFGPQLARNLRKIQAWQGRAQQCGFAAGIVP